MTRRRIKNGLGEPADRHKPPNRRIAPVDSLAGVGSGSAVGSVQIGVVAHGCDYDREAARDAGKIVRPETTHV